MHTQLLPSRTHIPLSVLEQTVTFSVRTASNAPELNFPQKYLVSKDKILKIQSPAVLWCHLLFHTLKSRREGSKKN